MAKVGHEPPNPEPSLGMLRHTSEIGSLTKVLGSLLRALIVGSFRGLLHSSGVIVVFSFWLLGSLTEQRLFKDGCPCYGFALATAAGFQQGFYKREIGIPIQQKLHSQVRKPLESEPD